MDWLTFTLTSLKDFGFPIVVAGWALFKLDKSYTKNEGFQSTIESLGDGQERIEITLKKQAEVQQELLLTVKIMQTIIVQNTHSRDGDNR